MDQFYQHRALNHPTSAGGPCDILHHPEYKSYANTTWEKANLCFVLKHMRAHTHSKGLLVVHVDLLVLLRHGLQQPAVHVGPILIAPLASVLRPLTHFLSLPDRWMKKRDSTNRELQTRVRMQVTQAHNQSAKVTRQTHLLVADLNHSSSSFCPHFKPTVTVIFFPAFSVSFLVKDANYLLNELTCECRGRARVTTLLFKSSLLY